MQNIKVRRFKLFPKKKSMAVMVYVYLIWFGVSALFMPIFLFALTKGDLFATLLWMVGLNAVFVWAPALLMGLRLRVPLHKVVMGFPAFFVLPYLNLFIYIRSVLFELVLGKKLNTWAKGH